MAGIDELSNLIMQELEDYSEEVEKATKKEIEKVAKEVRNDLQNNPDVPVRTGEYKKSFKLKKTAEGPGYSRFRVYNKKHQLTHLIERPHATRNGGRTKAHPHWKQAQEIADKLPERIKKVLSK